MDFVNGALVYIVTMKAYIRTKPKMAKEKREKKTETKIRKNTPKLFQKLSTLKMDHATTVVIVQRTKKKIWKKNDFCGMDQLT